MPAQDTASPSAAGGASVQSLDDGYRRGWGLQYGKLREEILKDRVFLEANEISKNRSIMFDDHRLNLYLLLRDYLGTVPFGHVIEFGTYRGGNAIFMAWVLRHLHPGVKVWALDTFRGMPETDADLDRHIPGDFDDVDLDELVAYTEEIGLVNIEFCQGLFEDTAADVLAQAGQIALAHIDCDIRSAVAYSYDVVKPYMVAGGYIVFDDATVSSCLGATRAVEELVIQRDGLVSEQIYPHFVFRS